MKGLLVASPASARQAQKEEPEGYGDVGTFRRLS